jgi:hypothetical protein
MIRESKHRNFIRGDNSCFTIGVTNRIQGESAQAKTVDSESDDWASYFLPSIFNNTTTAIIIDHHHTDITQIPVYWLEQAKSLTLHYAHTSHGSQLMSGISYWEGQDATYNYAVKSGGNPGLQRYYCLPDI